MYSYRTPFSSPKRVENLRSIISKFEENQDYNEAFTLLDDFLKELYRREVNKDTWDHVNFNIKYLPAVRLNSFIRTKLKDKMAFIFL